MEQVALGFFGALVLLNAAFIFWVAVQDCKAKRRKKLLEKRKKEYEEKTEKRKKYFERQQSKLESIAEVDRDDEHGIPIKAEPGDDLNTGRQRRKSRRQKRKER